MSKEATIIQEYNNKTREFEYFVKGYDVTKSVEILLKAHKEAYDKEKKVMLGTKGFIEAQKYYENQLKQLENNLLITEKALKLAVDTIFEHEFLEDSPEHIKKELEEYFKTKAKEMLNESNND